MLLLGACRDTPEGGGTGNAAEAPTGVTTTSAPNVAATQGDEYCGYARLYAKGFERFGQSGTSLEVRSFYRDATAAMQQAQRVSPAEIKADLDVVADTLKALVAGLEGIGYDFTKVSSLPPDLIQRLMSQEFVDASRKVASYSRDKCGIS